MLHILHNDLQTKFGITKPTILVAGLNPHAGEQGHLGWEEIQIIEPELQSLREQGLDVRGPYPYERPCTSLVRDGEAQSLRRIETGTVERIIKQEKVYLCGSH